MKKMKQTKTWQVVLMGLVISTIIALLIDYLLPTAWNFRSEGTWIKVFLILLIYTSIHSIAVEYAQAKHMIVKIAGAIEEQDVIKTSVSFVISVIQYVDVDGNTYVYMGTEDGTVYKALFHENEELLFAEIGNTVKGVVVNGVLTVEEITTITEELERFE